MQGRAASMTTLDKLDPSLTGRIRISTMICYASMPGAIPETSLLDNEIEHGALPSRIPAALASSASQTHGGMRESSACAAPALPCPCGPGWVLLVLCHTERCTVRVWSAPRDTAWRHVRLRQAVEGFGPTGQNTVLGRCGEAWPIRDQRRGP